MAYKVDNLFSIFEYYCLNEISEKNNNERLFNV